MNKVPTVGGGRPRVSRVAGGFLCVSLCWSALQAPAVLADTVYKFQDASGRWTFTNVRPKGQPQVETITFHYDGEQPYRSELNTQKTRVRLSVKAVGASQELVATNPFLAPVQIRVTPGNFQLAQADFVVPPGATQVLTRQPAGEPLQYRHRWVLGDPGAQSSGFLYYPPLASGERFVLSQGFNGPFSHFRDSNRYAVDVAMPVGSRVHAARGGLVVEAEDRQPNTSKQAWNYLRILHDDGTIAVYGHLQQGGIRVREGERVAAGQWVALSGNTGPSTGPHLHFAVQQNVGMKTVSIPFEFRDARGLAFKPVSGEMLSRN